VYNLHKYLRLRGLSSSVSVVSGYGLDGREIEVRSPAGEMDFSSNLCVHTGSGAQPLVQWVPGVLSPGLKRGRGVTLITPLQLVQRSWMSRSYTPLPPSTSMECSGTALLLLKTELLNLLNYKSCKPWKSTCTAVVTFGLRRLYPCTGDVNDPRRCTLFRVTSSHL
jgi:hypothetical protein